MKDDPVPPEWLPPNMRYTADPVERLRCILTSLAEVADGPNRCLLRARAAKVQHLCLEIDKGACDGPMAPPANLDEALRVIEMARGFLGEPTVAAKPPVALIYSIYVCAVAVSALAQSSAAGAA